MLEHLIVKPGEAANLAGRDPHDTLGLPGQPEANERLKALPMELSQSLTATSTEFAPWYVVPADRKWVRNMAVATLLVETQRRLDPQFPQPQFDAVTIE